MNRHDRRAMAATARRGHLGHWLECGCDRLGRFACEGICSGCGASDRIEQVLPTGASIGDRLKAAWSPCRYCGEGEIEGQAICMEVHPL